MDEPSSSNHDDDNGFDLDVIGSQTLCDPNEVFEDDNEEVEDSGDEENGEDADIGDGPQVGEGAWVHDVWMDPIDPHPTEPREGRTETDLDPDFDPVSEVTTIPTLLSCTFSLDRQNDMYLRYSYDRARCVVLR